MILFVAMLLAEKPIGPYRDAGVEIRSNLPATEIIPCIARLMGKAGNVSVLPIEGGSAIDLADRGTIVGARGTPWFSMQVTEASGDRRIRATYRHPMSAKMAQGFVADAERKCLQDASKEPL